jgi:predicted dehydrogenase
MDTYSRRRFLEQSLGIISASSLTTIATANRDERKRKGPNDRVNVAVIGVRSRGQDHVKGYLDQPDANLVAVCDADENVIAGAMTLAEKKGIPKPRYYSDIRKLLEDSTIDAVSIATPNHWHALAAIWAMQNGKDVYVEKPVSHNVHEGRVTVQTARKYKKICQTGTQIRSMQGTRDAIQYIHSGKIGKVTLARGLCYKRRKSIGVKSDTAVPMGVHYDLWLGPAPVQAFNPNRFHYEWHWNWNYGNGDLGNQGIHQMDVARWALNKNTMPKSVVALGGRFGYVDDGETPNTAISVMDYGDAELIFEVRGLETDPLLNARVGNIVYGTEGYVVFTGYDEAYAFDNKGAQVQHFKGGGDHYANFLSAVKSRKNEDLHADIEEGHLSSALCHLGNISYKLGKSQHSTASVEGFEGDSAAMETYGRFVQHLAVNNVRLTEATYRLGAKLKIDPKREEFIGNKEANTHLFREYRKPFEVPSKA